MNSDELPYQKHSNTSRQAAESMAPSAGTLRMLVFNFLKENGPASDEQIQEALNMNPSTQRPRRIELQNAGLIEVFGETKTRSGRRAKMWSVVKSDIFKGTK